jgi:hypothetical protein
MALASTEGGVTIRADSAPFIEAFVRRIDAGLLEGRPHPRSRYVVTGHEGHALRFRAADWPTALNVGLNDVELSVSGGQVQYRIHFSRWAAYALFLCGTLGVALMVFFAAVDLRAYVAANPSSALPGLTIDQNVAIGWTMALFWGFAWPWLLIALHKRPLRKLAERIISEVDAAACRGGGGSQDPPPQRHWPDNSA